jgi:ABC-type transport system substrate-binding protein
VGGGGHPALRNKLVRRALAYGLDRAAIVSAVYGDYLPKWRPSQSAVLLGASSHYEPNWGVYRYRPALARRLLAQAGVAGAPTASSPAAASVSRFAS